MQRLLHAIARHAVVRPHVVLGLAVLFTLVSIGLAHDIAIKTAFKDAMDADEPTVQAQTYWEDNFPGAFTVQVVVEGSDRQEMITVAKELAEVYTANTELVRAVYLEQERDFFIDHGMLFMEPDDLRSLEYQLDQSSPQLSALFADPSVVTLLDATSRLGTEGLSPDSSALSMGARVSMSLDPSTILRGPAVADVAMTVDTRPMQKTVEEGTHALLRALPLPGTAKEMRSSLRRTGELLELVADIMEKGERVTPTEFSGRVAAMRELDYDGAGGLPDRYNFSPDGRMLMFEVGAVQNVSHIELAKPFVLFLQEATDGVTAGRSDVSVGFAGMPVMFIEESQALLDNFILVTILAFIGVLAVFIIGFERVGLPALSAIPMLMGVIWTFGSQGLLRGEMNLFDLVFPVLLLGLGIDFAIHILSAFSARRAGGDELEEALQGTFDDIGRGLVTGAVTTAAAFFALASADFKGGRTMGTVAGIGVIMALIAMVVVLPALLVLWDRRQQGQGVTLPDVPFTFMLPLATWIRRHRFAVLAGFLVVSLVMAWHAPQVTIDKNAMSIEPVGLPSMLLQERILEAYETSTEVVAFFAKDLEEAERIRQLAETARTVGEVMSVSQAIPTHQEAKAEVISSIATKLEGLVHQGERPVHAWNEEEQEGLADRLAEIKAVLLELSFSASMLYPQDVQDQVANLRSTLNRIERGLTPLAAPRLQYLDRRIAIEVDRTLTEFRRMASHTKLDESGLPGSFTNRLKGKDDNWMVIVRASGDVWEPAFLEAHVSELKSIHPRLAGMVPTFHRLVESVSASMPRMLGLSAVVVILLVLFDLRSIKGSLLVLTPLVLGVLWTLGILGILGIPFNIISIMALPLIVGIGIDDGVHVYHRIRKEGALGPALLHSGKAVTLTSLTTGIGFGSLLLSVHRGFYALGFVTLTGVICCLVISILLLPALVAIFDPESIPNEPRTGTFATVAPPPGSGSLGPHG